MAFESLSDKLGSVFKNLRQRGKLNEKDVRAAMREVRLALLEADVNYKVAKEFVAKATEEAVGEKDLESLTPAQQVIKIDKDNLCELMRGDAAGLTINSKPPTVFMMCGLQGSGKTTHSAKLAKMLKSQGRRPLLVACDIYRPAAIKQLQVVGEKADVRVFEMGTEKPVKIAKAAVAHAKDHGNDVVILDTAGRLHIDEELMGELSDIKKSIDPTEILLVVDAMTGQDAVNVSKTFDETLGISGVILTKMDGDTRGGAALSVRAVTGKPIKFVGTGEKLDNIEQFHPERMASRILGMGDMLTLIEKAEKQFDEKKAEELTQKMRQNTFDLNDMLEQFAQLKKMGSMQQILSMLPGSMTKQLKGAELDESQFVRMEAIIMSMTPREREKPKTINPSRKRRIAAGSGMKVEDVNKILRQHEQMQKMMKMMTGGKGRKKGRRGMRLPPELGGGNMPY